MCDIWFCLRDTHRIYRLVRHRLDLREQEIIDSYPTAPEQDVEFDEEEDKTVGWVTQPRLSK